MHTALASRNQTLTRSPAPTAARAHVVIRNILRGPAVQPKLKIGAANDPAEREADAVADRVMAMHSPSPEPGIEQVSPIGRSIQRMCAGCEDEVQRMTTGEGAEVDEEELIQPKERPGAGPALSAASASAIRGLGGGTPLAASERAFFEPRFGRDFSRVRIHDDAAADASARSINARAYTLGSDIAFGRGEYTPGTPSGRRLLAHELAHVEQQDRGSSVIRRTAGKDAADSWDELVTPIFPRKKSTNERAKKAVGRLRATAANAKLINDLWKLFCLPRNQAKTARIKSCKRSNSTKCMTRIFIEFHDSLAHVGTDDPDGHAGPAAECASRYTVSIKNKTPVTGRIFTTRYYPDINAPERFAFTHQDPETEMAATLFHELLHLWWYSGRTKWIHVPGIYEQVIETGHGTDPESDIETAFLNRLKDAFGDLDRLEIRLKKEAAEEAKKKAAPAPISPEFDPGDISERSEPSEPSIVGGRVLIRGGAAGGFGTEDKVLGTGIVGADLLLGRISAFGLGGRGVYVTPKHLLAGPVISFRYFDYDTGGFGHRAVNNPLFFDIEAGALFEIPTAEGEEITEDTIKITEDFAGYASAGIGQEIGTSGPRFYWRLGGFVVISDKKDTRFGGGGTAGIGGRF